jgi:voltage-gated potassium channel
MSIVSRYRRLLARWRWSLLLALLIGDFLLQPLLAMTAFDRVLGYALFALIFGGAVSLGRGHLRMKRAVPFLLLVGFGLEVAILRGAALEGALATVALLVVAAALVATFSELIGSRDTSPDSLVGAIFGYFLLAAAWGLLYFQIEAWRPGSFGLTEAGAAGEQLLYFSIITLTTVGYGDIVPLAPAARSAAGLEAMAGTLYIAILIGRIVGQLRFGTGRPAPRYPDEPRA